MKKILLIVACVLVLILGAGVALWLMKTGPEPAEETPESEGVLVETMEVSRRKHRVDLSARGVVGPARSIQLLPRISGKLVETHPELEPGGVVEKGGVLARIDPDDYRIAVERAEAALTRAESGLRLEEGRAAAAKQEWELLENKEEIDAANRALALREPQMAAAKARVESAEAALRRAELNLERTRLRAPFPSVVLEESADVGQFVSPRTPLATLADRGAFWVVPSLPVEALPWISFAETDGQGSKVEVDQDGSTWTGRVLRRMPAVTSGGRMAQVLVEVPDPLEGENPLLIGSYVEAHVREVRNGAWIEIPRRALRRGDEVWVEVEGKLEIRKVEIAWRREDTVLISTGLEDGDRVVMTNLPAPVPGLKLRLAEAADGG